MSVLIPVFVIGVVAGTALLVALLGRGRGSAAEVEAAAEPAAGTGAGKGAVGAVVARTTWWRWTGILAGLAVAYVAVQSGSLGQGMLLAAPLFGLCVLGGVLVGEATVHAPGGPLRAARLEVRRARDYLPRRLTWVVAAAGGVLLAILTVTTAAGSADDLGRAGRSLARQCTPDMVTSHGPWPGSYYSLPLGGVVLTGLVVAALVLHRVVLRPRSGGDAGVDDGLRRRTAEAVVGACGVLIGVPLAGVSVVTAAGLLGIGCRPAWWSVAGWGLVALVPVVLGVLGWCTAVLLAPVGAGRVGAEP